MERDLTIKEFMDLMQIKTRNTAMSIIAAHDIKFYRTTKTNRGRPRIPRSELEKLRTSKYAKVS